LSQIGGSSGGGGASGIFGFLSTAVGIVGSMYGGVSTGLASGADAAGFAPGATDLFNGNMAKNGAYFDGGLSFFADGGTFTNGIYSDPTLFKFANGGKFGVMGEAGPEAVMPLSRDGSGRLGVAVNEGMMGGDSTQVNIAITINKDGGESSSESSAGQGDDEASQWRQMANRVKSVVREELAIQQRPGGLLYAQ
jgi:phage-related minor tail protein